MLAMTFTQFDEALIKIVGAFVAALAVILILQIILLPQLFRMFGLPNWRKTLVQVAE
jgi:hypothetical protein